MAQKTSVQPAITPQASSDAPTAPEGSQQDIRAGTSLRALMARGEGDTLQSKMAFMGDIRQKLAQIADEDKDNAELSKETAAIADSATTSLFKARAAGTITGDELSALLGDTFGYKPKQDGTPGKTPAGTGERIRKTVVRLVQGRSFIEGGEGGRFFETMDVTDVQPVIEAVGRTKKVEHTAEDGTKTEEIVSDGYSAMYAYKLLGDIKSQGTVRLPFAFDPKKIIGLQEALSEAGARDTVISNPVLLRAYLGLLDQLEIINQVDASEVAAIQAKLGLVEDEEEEEEDGEKVAA